MPLTQMAYIDAAQLDEDLEDVADAIRAKSGGSSPLAFPAGFISEIGSISVPTLDTLTATDNGTYTPTSGHAYDEVVVNVPKGITPSGTKQITENGTFDVTQFASAEVNVPTGGGAQSITFLDWENKAITSSSGGISGNSQRIMCAHQLRKFLSMVIPTGYDYAIFANKDLAYFNLYSYSATYLGSWTGTTWAKSLTWHVADGTPVDFTSLTDWEDCFLFIVIRNSGSDTTIDPSVGSNVQFTYDTSNGSFYL